MVSTKDLIVQQRNNASISFGNSTRFWELVGIVAASRLMQCEIAMKIVTEKIKTMTEELRKRLEEAAERKAGCESWLCYERSEKCKETCIKYKYARECMEQGYNEAIKVAKDWLKNNVSDYTAEYIVGCSKGQFITDFESDMNKLLKD